MENVKAPRKGMGLTNTDGEPDKYPELGFEVIAKALEDYQVDPQNGEPGEWFKSRSMTAGGYGWCLDVSGVNPNGVRRILDKMLEGFFFSNAEIHVMLKEPRYTSRYWERNAAIRARYEELKNGGAPAGIAISRIASEVSMGVPAVRKILYNPRAFVMSKPIPRVVA